jgi:phosphonopyruvate decarboxylase
MIDPEDLFRKLQSNGVVFFTGVPDSLLKDFCAYLEDNAETNIITANEGNSIGLAAGYYLAKGKPACVYMQNSGIGNAVNPLVSLMDEDVYKIPVLMFIGWRGEPGVKDEPQHVKQGKITLSLLESMGIDYMILDAQETAGSLWEKAAPVLESMRPFAVVVKKGIFSEYKLKNTRDDISVLERERAIELVTASLNNDDLVVATTGKISRELYEIREKNRQSHSADFLTVGSMGHASQIAMGVALARRDKTVYCFDGDGSVLMHMGSLAVNAACKRDNFKHIVFNNGAHDSVGGQPTAAANISLASIASSSGYEKVKCVDNETDLKGALKELKTGPLQFLEIRVRKGSRGDLGRPKAAPQDCKNNFMELL